jgi:hypothetical protein
MLKKAITGFVLIVAVLAIIHMYKGSAANMEEHAAQVQVAQNTRPADLQHLGRAAVRKACTTHSDWDMDTCQAIDQKDVVIGMTGEQVRLSIGKPNRINATVFSGHQHEQWVYGRDYVNLENDVVRSVQTSRN